MPLAPGPALTKRLSDLYTPALRLLASGTSRGAPSAAESHVPCAVRQALPVGLVDGIRVHVIPILVGGGTLLFGSLDSAITLERTRVVATPAATHLAFQVVR